MAFRPRANSSRRRSQSARTLKSALGLTVLLCALALLVPSVLAELPVLELPPDQPLQPIQVVASPQVELAAVVNELKAKEPPLIDSPAKVDVYTQAGTLAQSAAVTLARQLEPLGLSRDALFRYALLHSRPPALTLRGRVLVEMLPSAETRLLKDNKAELKKLSEALRKLWTSARLEAVLDRYRSARENAATLLTNAYSGDEPRNQLTLLLDDPPVDSPILLVPSLLTSSAVRFKVPIEHAQSPFRVSVIPLQGGTLDAARARYYRYTETASWLFEPIFRRFQLELSEAGAGGQSVADQLVQALYFVTAEPQHPDQVPTLRDSAIKQGGRLIRALEAAIRAWQGDHSASSSLELRLPELLERAAEVAEGRTSLPELNDGGFERWSGAVLEFWNVQVVEPAQDRSARPSRINRVRGEPRAGWALQLQGDRDTNEWQGVFSEPLPVVAGDRISVKARMRSHDVKPQGRNVIAAHLEARVFSRDGVLLRRVVGKDFTGTTFWEDVRFDVTIPASADRMQLGAVLTLPGELMVDSVSFTIERPSLRRFLRNGGFNAQGPTSSSSPTAAPEGWESMVVAHTAQSGPVRVSRWELDPEGTGEGRYSLKLIGEDQTSQWIELRSTPVAVTPGQKVSLKGMLRARGITLSARQHRHANLVITFLTASGAEVQRLETPALEGSSGWKQEELELVVPLEAVSVRVSCLLTMTGEVWFDDIHLSRR